jgi:RNA polymerase sigma-70 factor (sigma-E family)
VTNAPRRASADQAAEEVTRLIEKSSLGTDGAGQLRDRGTGHAAAIRALAYFAATSPGGSWWHANQQSPGALRAKASELAAADPEISAVLARIADDLQAAADLGAAAARICRAPIVVLNVCQSADYQEPAADWVSFGDFYTREGDALTTILCQQADLPGPLARKLIFRAMVEAFDDWEQLVSAGDPGEWVVGRALQLFRAHRQLDSREGSELGTTSSSPVVLTAGSPSAVTRADDVRVTGALAVAASHVEVCPVPGAATVRGRREPECHVRSGDVSHTLRDACCTAEQVAERPPAVEADRGVTELYSMHYRSLVRLAALLLRDVATAEEVVQDSFVLTHSEWSRLGGADKALSYLRQAVVNRCRSVLRHRVVVDQNAPKPSPGMPSAEHDAIILLERSAVVSALRTLPPRQREALVLRYYGDMSEAQIADIMGISRGAVKSHTARAMTALRGALERAAPD